MVNFIFLLVLVRIVSGIVPLTRLRKNSLASTTIRSISKRKSSDTVPFVVQSVAGQRARGTVSKLVSLEEIKQSVAKNFNYDKVFRPDQLDYEIHGVVKGKKNRLNRLGYKSSLEDVDALEMKIHSKVPIDIHSNPFFFEILENSDPDSFHPPSTVEKKSLKKKKVKKTKNSFRDKK